MELEPVGKAADEIRQLYQWTCRQIDMPQAQLRQPSCPRVPAPAPPPAVDHAAAEAAEATPRPSSREGRKQIAGFFSLDMSLAIHLLARRQGRSLQALMAEAFNDALRKYGENPVGDSGGGDAASSATV